MKSRRRQLPSIEEAWNLPISAEMSSRQQQQQQQQQQQKTVQTPYQKSQDMIASSPQMQPPPYNSSKPDNSLEINTKRIKVSFLFCFA